MAATDFIVAIELGSSKITGIAGKKHADGSIQVLALASENSSDFIRKGVIYNLDKTAQSLTSIIKKLESTLKASIGKVYVGIGGQSLRTIRNTEVRHLEMCIRDSFDGLPKTAFALTNLDDKNGLVMTQNNKAKVHTYSLRSLSDFKGKVLEDGFEGMLLDINNVAVSYTHLLQQPIICIGTKTVGEMFAVFYFY